MHKETGSVFLILGLVMFGISFISFVGVASGGATSATATATVSSASFPTTATATSTTTLVCSGNSYLVNGQCVPIPQTQTQTVTTSTNAFGQTTTITSAISQTTQTPTVCGTTLYQAPNLFCLPLTVYD